MWGAFYSGLHGNPSFGILLCWGNSFSFIKLSISQCCKHNIVYFICILVMLNLPVCRLLCLCGAIIRLYGSTNGAQCSTAVSWILPAPGVLSFPSISHTLAKLFAVQKYTAVLRTGEALNYYYNYKFQWPMVTSTYLFKFFGFVGSQANSDTILCQVCSWLSNISWRKHFKLSTTQMFPTRQCTLEDLRNNEEIAIKQWIWVLGAVNYLLLSNVSASLRSTFHHHLHYLNFHF